MRKSRLAIIAVGLSAAAVTGSAFTAANTMSATSNVAGYGQMTATGMVVTNIEYDPNASDPAILDTVRVVTSTNVTGKDVVMALRTAGGTTVVGTPYTCAASTAWTGTSMTFTCSTTGSVRRFADFDATGFTVTQ